MLIYLLSAVGGQWSAFGNTYKQSSRNRTSAACPLG